MPSLNRRREIDLRADRFESTIRDAEKEQAMQLLETRRGLPYCNRCKYTFEERSRTCPRCDRKDEMGSIRKIPEEFREQARQGAIKRSMRRITGG